jgi:2-dehydropantoate 2-reductase
MPKTLAPLRIAILGVGKIGSAFAFQLARSGGHDVTVIARPGSARWAQLERDQAIVDVKGERASVRVVDRLDEETPFDLVIVTLLAHQMGPVLPALQRSVAGCIQFMFNTFDPQSLQAAIGLERCAFGMPFVQATLDGDGRLKVAIGAAGQKTIMSQQRWVDAFNAAGLPAAFEPEMLLWLRCHTPLCVAFESVSVAAVRRGGGASWREALVLARGVHASFRLIKSLGYDIYPRVKTRIDRSPMWVMAMILWSMSRLRSFRALLATGEAECCALVDSMASSASLVGAPVVVSEITAMKPVN